MQISHIAIWTNKLEELKSFYSNWFNVSAGSKYVNLQTGFESYFLNFESGGVKLEIMTKPGLSVSTTHELSGLAHFAISVGSKKRVDELTSTLEKNNIKIISYPRTTGDGYYESVIADPDGNLIEITI
jgi:lactoylglutathione lyase